MDLKASDKVFKASAFEPTEEDIRNYKRKQRSPKKGGVESRRFATEVPEELASDSDDDLPDVAHMLDKKSKGRRRAKVLISDDDDDVRVFRGPLWGILIILPGFNCIQRWTAGQVEEA